MPAELPPWLEPALASVPAAVLAALVAPALVTLVGSGVGLVNGRVLFWRTDSMTATIGGGMLVLWRSKFLLYV